MHDSAVPSVRPCVAAELEHELLHRSLVAAEEVLGRAARRTPARARRRAPRRRARRSGRRGSRSRGRRSSPRPRPRRRPRRRGPSRRPTRSRRRTGARGARASIVSRQDPLERLRLDRPRPQPLQLARRAREHDDHAACPRRARRPGAVPAMPSETAPSGSVACFRTPGAKSAYGRRMRSAKRREICSISASSAASTCERTAGDAGHELDRPVVVGRPEAARDEADVGLEPLAQRGLELVGIVADDRDARRLETEPQRLLGVERAVEIGSLAPDELAARHDDCCARARSRARRDRALPARRAP